MPQWRLYVCLGQVKNLPKNFYFHLFLSGKKWSEYIPPGLRVKVESREPFKPNAST